MKLPGGITRGRLIVLALLLALAGSAPIWWRDALKWLGLGSKAQGTDTVYWCPMHPQIKRTTPNEVCPICNMALVPLEGADGASSSQGLVLTPRQVQQAGVVTEPILRRKLRREIDTTGRLDYDERLYRTVTAWVRGKSRIDRLHVRFVGDVVEKGKLLAEIYSPELIVAQEEYLIALESQPTGSLLEAARKKLEYWGLKPEQIEQLARRGKALDRIPIYAEIGGTVLRLPVREGEYVNEGDPLFHLADLSRLWLIADVYEEELPLVKEGQEATVSIRGVPGGSFKGTVAFIDPNVQPQTRTVRVRLDVENRRRESPLATDRQEWLLKPGLFARVQFQADVPEKLAVPENAVLQSGRRSVVLVKEGEGLFRPREVELGQKWLYPREEKPRRDGKRDFGADHKRYHEVVAGLHPGEDVVTAGAFLLNAESQFQNVLAKMLPPESERATLEEVLGRPLAERLRGVLEAYYPLSQALAEDGREAVAARSEALAGAAETLARQAEEAKEIKLADRARRLAALARDGGGRPPKDLRDARIAFGRISQQLVPLLVENGGKTLLGRELFFFKCGMFEDAYDRWLWHSPVKLNPYMGREMLH